MRRRMSLGTRRGGGSVDGLGAVVVGRVVILFPGDMGPRSRREKRTLAAPSANQERATMYCSGGVP